jgi:hypothetical protein
MEVFILVLLRLNLRLQLLELLDGQTRQAENLSPREIIL